MGKWAIYLNKVIATMLFAWLFNVSLFAQITPADANSNFADANYSIALDQYRKLIKKDPNNALFNYRIGYCILYSNEDKTQALPYLEVAAKTAKIATDINFLLAKAHFHSHKFDEAVKFFKLYETEIEGDKNFAALKIEIDTYLQYCKNAKQIISRPVSVELVNVGKAVNSRRSEYLPFVAPDESYLIFTSDKKFISDFLLLVNCVYISTPFWGRWNKPRSVGSKVNSDEDEICVNVTPDGQKMLVQLQRMDFFNDIFVSTKKGKAYTELSDLGKTINTKFSESGACFSPSQDTLYFASDRPGGIGGLDLYMCVKLPDGQWGIPQNLGLDLNTTTDENFPNMLPDGKTLYFCSKGHNSMGGFDIFKTVKDADGNWSKPTNVGYPINTTNDDFSISFTANKRYAYISSIRPEGEGCADIYKVIFKEVEQKSIVILGKIAVGVENLSQPLANVDPEISMTMYQIDNKDEKFDLLSDEPIKIIDPKNIEGLQLDNVFGEYSYRKTTGSYILSVPPGKYIFEIKGAAYEPFYMKIFVPERVPESFENLINIYLKKKLSSPAQTPPRR